MTAVVACDPNLDSLSHEADGGIRSRIVLDLTLELPERTS